MEPKDIMVSEINEPQANTTYFLSYMKDKNVDIVGLENRILVLGGGGERTE